MIFCQLLEFGGDDGGEYNFGELQPDGTEAP
jgi:hypothetical protein